ncbi:MAG: hypothetical protein J3K34DRAFT_519095 [Monoraphidium minutum]|nr:MAG: hypothetical protein J3K34DRAFT_519095 [Monoraphidium minutum]
MVRNHLSATRSDNQKRQKAEVASKKLEALLQLAGMTRQQAEKDPVKFIITLWPQHKKDVKRLSERWLATRGVSVMLEEGQDALYTAAGELTIPTHPLTSFGERVRTWYPGLKIKVDKFNDISLAAALAMLRTPGRARTARKYKHANKKTLNLADALAQLPSRFKWREVCESIDTAVKKNERARFCMETDVDLYEQDGEHSCFQSDFELRRLGLTVKMGNLTANCNAQTAFGILGMRDAAAARAGGDTKAVKVEVPAERGALVHFLRQCEGRHMCHRGCCNPSHLLASLYNSSRGDAACWGAACTEGRACRPCAGGDAGQPCFVTAMGADIPVAPKELPMKRFLEYNGGGAPRPRRPGGARRDILPDTLDTAREKIEEMRRHVGAAAPPPPDEQLQLQELLGEGAFGKVYKGLWRGTIVAVKEPLSARFMLPMATEQQVDITSAAVTISGFQAVIFDQSRCPTPDELPAALEKAYLSVPKGWRAINFGDLDIEIFDAKGNKMAQITGTGIKGGWWSEPAGAEGIVMPQQFGLSGETSIKDLSGLFKFLPPSISLTAASRNTQISLDCPDLRSAITVPALAAGRRADELLTHASMFAAGALSNGRLVPAGSLYRPGAGWDGGGGGGGGDSGGGGGGGAEASPAPQPQRAQQAAGVCAVALEAHGALSSSGELTRPVSAQMPPTEPAQLTGSITIVIPQGMCTARHPPARPRPPCPSAAELAGALRSAYLATPKGWPGISVGDMAGTVEMWGTTAAGFATEGLEASTHPRARARAEFWSDPAAGAAGATRPNFRATAGVTRSSSLMGANPPAPLATGASLAVASGGCRLSAAAGAVRLACAELGFELRISDANAAGVLRLDGRVDAEGAVAGGRVVPREQATGALRACWPLCGLT